MKMTITLDMFKAAFVDFGSGDSFSEAGFSALFNWLEKKEKDCDREMVLDVVRIDCDFTEYADLEAFQMAYSYNDDYECLEDIAVKTNVIKVGHEGFIVQNF